MYVVVPARNLHEDGAHHDASQGVEVGGNQCFVGGLRKPFVSPSEWCFITAQISTWWSLSRC